MRSRAAFSPANRPSWSACWHDCSTRWPSPPSTAAASPATNMAADAGVRSERSTTMRPSLSRSPGMLRANSAAAMPVVRTTASGRWSVHRTRGRYPAPALSRTQLDAARRVPRLGRLRSPDVDLRLVHDQRHQQHQKAGCGRVRRPLVHRGAQYGPAAPV